MSRSKKSITLQSQWTLILVGGLAIIYISLHWQAWFDDHKSVASGEIAAAVIQPNADMLEIPSLHIKAPIIYSKSEHEKDIEYELVNGVVHLTNTALPGESGNDFIVGHSSNYKDAPGIYNQIFKELPNINVGEVIYITHDKTVYKYTVYATRIVEPTELWVMSQETSGQKDLTLQTSYPVGTSRQRFIAQARLSR